MNYGKDKEILERLAKQLQNLKSEGKTGSAEYEEISEEWQGLAQGLVISEILVDPENGS